MPSSSSSVRSGGAPVGVDRGGAAGEDQRARRALADPLDRGVVREQLGEDAALADPARDQLRVLAAEVEDEDLLDAGRVLGLGDRLEIGLRERRALGLALGDRRGDLRGAGELSHRPQSSLTATPADTRARPFEPIPTDCWRCSALPSVCRDGATMTSARWNEGMSS